MSIWYEVYEDDERGSSYQILALCKFKYTAETVARYFPCSKIRKITQLNKWEGEEI